MDETNAKEFVIKDAKAFGEALENLQAPKTANAYIPSGKRINWDEARERMGRYAERGKAQ